MHQSIINQPFFPQSQPGQQSSPHNMGPFQNNQGGNPSLGLMGGQPGAPNAGYPLNMQQAPPGRRPGMFMGPHPGGPAPSSLNAPGGGGGPSHMANLGPGQLQSMSSFPGGNLIRRVQSQPMNPNGAHMQGMQSGMQHGMQPGMMGGGMARTPMTPAQQQQQQKMLQLRQQQQQAQLQAQGGALPPEMGLPMNRPTHMQGAGSMPHARTASGQALMSTSMSQHGMQQPMHQQLPHGGYPTPMSLQHQHQQGQLGTSPHIGGQQQPNMPQLASQTPTGRSQMASDNPMFMGFQNQPIRPPTIHGIPQIPNNSQFNFNASPTPPNLGPNLGPSHSGDMSQRGNPTTQGLITPAQALDKMNSGIENFPVGSYAMGQPPMNVPQRPPSQHSPRNPFPIPQSQPPHPPPQQSPRQADRLAGPMQPPGLMQRPQSQPQVHHRQSPIPPGSSRTPRAAHTPLPMNGGINPQGRIPPGPGQSPQGPAHQQVQQPASAPPSSHPAQIAPRPPSANAVVAARAAPQPSVRPPSASQQRPAPETNPVSQAAPPAPAPASVPAPVAAPAPAPPPAPAPAPTPTSTARAPS